MTAKHTSVAYSYGSQFYGIMQQARLMMSDHDNLAKEAVSPVPGKISYGLTVMVSYKLK